MTVAVPRAVDSLTNRVERSMSQTFIAVTESRPSVEWLQKALEGMGAVIHSEGQSLGEVLALVEVAGASVVFVSLSKANLVKGATFIEGLLASNPLLSVIAVGEGMDNELVLAAMRAGARDFIAYGARPSELGGLVRRVSEKIPVAVAKNPLQQGSLVCITSSRPAAQASVIAMHMAVALQEKSATAKVLLLDLGMPFGDAFSVWGLESGFTFEDALRNIRRLDQTMIESAFPRHESGVRVLSMPVEGMSTERISSAEMFLLIGTLRGFFSNIVVNIAGLPESDFVHLLVGNANSVMMLIDQSIPSCKSGMEYCRRLREAGVPMQNPRLIIDGYIANIPPDREAIAQSFGIDQVVELPSAPEARLRIMNLGKTIYELSPKDSMAQRLRALANDVDAGADAKKSPVKNFFKNMMGRG